MDLLRLWHTMKRNITVCTSQPQNVVVRLTPTATATPNLLPLPPAITPGFAVGGVILMLSGVVYTLIGIKNKWYVSKLICFNFHHARTLLSFYSYCFVQVAYLLLRDIPC